MRKWLMLLVCLGVFFCGTTNAQTLEWVFGGITNLNGTNCSILGNPFTETILNGTAGYLHYSDFSAPKTGDGTYVSISMSVPGLNCNRDSSVGFVPSLVLPPGASLNINAQNPVRCFFKTGNLATTQFTGTQIGIDSPQGTGFRVGPVCPDGQAGGVGTPFAINPNVQGTYGGIALGFQYLTQTSILEIQIPVIFSKQLKGAAGSNGGDKLGFLLDSSALTPDPGLAETWINVGYNASFQNLASGAVTSSTADLAFTLSSYFNTGLLYVDFGTTTVLGSSTTPVNVPNTAASFSPTSQLNGLSPATTYYWQARFVSPDGTFISSPLQSFTTAGSTPQTLSVSKNGTGTGNVTSNLAGIDCGMTCSTNFAQGTSVTLTAAPVIGSSFTGWSGACTGRALTCTVAMNAAQSVNASFARDTGSLSFSVTGLPSGSSATLGVTGPDGFNSPQKILTGVGVSLSDVPTGVYTVTAPDVAVNGTIYKPDFATRNLTVNAVGPNTVNVVYSAVAPSTFALNVTKSGTGTGSLSSNPAGIDCGTTCTTNFNQGTSVTLTPTASSGSSFSGWTGACTGGTVCTVTMDAAKSVTATFNLTPKFGLTLTKNGTGTGAVSSAPAGIDCGTTCTSSFIQGTSVTLTPTAASGSSFTGWAGGCTGTGACTVTMDAAKSVSATFNTSVVPTFSLAITKNGTGAGSISSTPSGLNCGSVCTANFDQNTVVSLTATAASGSSFAGWTGACTGLTTCSVTMSAAKTVTATFNPIPTFALTVTKNGTGTGTVSSSPIGIDCGATCTFNFNQNSSVTLTPTAASGSSFVAWAGACTGTGTCTVTMDVIKTVTATFNTNPIPTFALTITKAGTGSGSISSNPAGINCGTTCGSSFNQGTSITLTSTPAAGSSFAGWTGACTGTATCVVTMDAVKTVTATFTSNPPANLALSKPGNAPADRMVLKGSSNNAALAFAFTLPGGSLSSITLNVSGSGNDATDLTNVKLYKDSNANGLVDANELLLASGKFLGNDGTLTLTPASVALLAASGATQFVIAVDVNNALAALRFAPALGGLLLMGLGLRRRRWLGAVGLVLLLSSCQPSIPTPEIRTYQINLTAVTAKNSSNLAVNITGLPIAGAILSAEK